MAAGLTPSNRKTADTRHREAETDTPKHYTCKGALRPRKIRKKVSPFPRKASY